ncbi:MAG TPA: hypothetical protein VMJ65_29975 [Solirubrobacteraceae bacterium]|nr:hypothetical protein [Solirubrobacteraceae bacterium]
MDLDAYRHTSESFITELMREYYRHYAGLKDEFEIEAIYAAHEGLFTRDAVHALRDLDGRAIGGGDEQRRARMLLDFAVEGYVGAAAKAVDEELARAESALTIEVGEERIGFREAPVVQANEADPGRRAEIERALLAATKNGLGDLHRERLERQHACATELGWDSYADMCAHCKNIDLNALSGQTAAFARASARRYPEVLEPELRRTLGIGFTQLRRADLPRFFRAPEDDRHFASERLTESFIETMRGLGIDVSAQVGVTFDIESRRGKSPRAFCAPVRVPGEVYLVVAPVGGRDDYATLFHEGGHTEHAASTDPALPFEFRRLGDNSISETYAFLMQHLVEDPEWLSRRLGVEDPSELVAHARAQRLVYLRRYAGKIAYELELHGAGGADFVGLADRYSEVLGAALGIEWPTETFLSDVDEGFYCACYLRAWALETHLRSHLRQRFGAAWFDSPEAGAVLAALWREGQRLDAEELLEELTGERLDFGVVLADLGLTN